VDDSYTYDEKSKSFKPIDEKEGSGEGLGEIVKFALIAIVIVLPIRLFIAQPFIVSGTSMDPTFESGEYIIVDELSYRFNDPKRGDVVIFKFPEDMTKYFIKRIIGLPGETVIVSENSVTIKNDEDPDGVALEEPYLGSVGGTGTTITLGDDEYFVMGDNRRDSYDSRYWGAMPREDVVGRAFMRLLPVRKIDYLPGAFLLDEQK